LRHTCDIQALAAAVEVSSSAAGLADAASGSVEAFSVTPAAATAAATSEAVQVTSGCARLFYTQVWSDLVALSGSLNLNN
jgi:hypothetical protein